MPRHERRGLHDADGTRDVFNPQRDDEAPVSFLIHHPDYLHCDIVGPNAANLEMPTTR